MDGVAVTSWSTRVLAKTRVVDLDEESWELGGERLDARSSTTDDRATDLAVVGVLVAHGGESDGTFEASHVVWFSGFWIDWFDWFD